MGLEAAEFVAGLTEAWPLGSDKRRFGDDHIRLVKRALKNTFPNMDAQTTVTPETLNSLPVDVSAVVDEIVSHLLPAGMIVLWSGSIASIPTGWALCNGSSGTPDLRNRFIVGAGDTYAVAGTGGSLTTGAGGAHTPTIQGTALTTAQLPAHTHALKNYPVSVGSVTRAAAVWTASTTQDGTALSESTGSGDTHTHTADAVADHTHSSTPPYYALAYIMKLASYVAP